MWNTIKTLPPVLPSCFISWVYTASMHIMHNTRKNINLFFFFFVINQGPILNEGLEKFPWPAPSLVDAYPPSNQEPLNASKRRFLSPCLWIRRPLWGRGSLKRSRGQHESFTSFLSSATQSRQTSSAPHPPWRWAMLWYFLSKVKDSFWFSCREVG